MEYLAQHVKGELGIPRTDDGCDCVLLYAMLKVTQISEELLMKMRESGETVDGTFPGVCPSADGKRQAIPLALKL